MQINIYSTIVQYNTGDYELNININGIFNI